MRLEEDAILDIKGFCSVNIDKQLAIETALAEEEENENESLLILVEKEGPLQSVMYQIQFTDVCFHFELSGSMYSAFPDEQELVL